jgi:hypothetical protein
MRSLKVLCMFMCVLALAGIAVAGPNSMGIRDVNKVTFNAPMRVGTVVLPAGDYVVRHTMEGQDHVMVFQRVHSKDEFKVKCTLVPLPQKADKSQIVYDSNPGSERVLQELEFVGDSAKHVF